MRRTLLLLVILISITGFFKNGTQAQTYPTEIKTAIYHDVSIPIRDMETVKSGVLFQSAEERNKTLQTRSYPFWVDEGPDPVLQSQQSQTKAAGTIVQNFLGQSSGSYPPDCNGAVGPNHFMQTINVSFAIYNKSGALLAGPTNMNTLFSGVTGATNNDGDPIVLYDEQADRWFAAEFSISGSNDYMLIAVSQTNDPTGSWNRYSFDVADMPDYMKFGIWRDGYYMSTNNPGSNDVYVFERDVMIAGGASPKMVGFTNANRPNSGFHCIMPVDNDWSYAPSGTPGQFITINDNAWGGTDQIWIYQLAVNWSNTASSTFTRTQQINTASFDSNFGSSWDNIAQPNGQKLDAISQILMYRAQYINFTDHQTIVCCHAVDAGSDKAGVRWYELINTGSGWSIRQQGTYSPDANSRWIGSISMNLSKEIGLAYSVSSTTLNPSIRFTGQTAAENALASGLMDVTETSLVAGTASQSGANRWGDYAEMSVDPSDNITFWFTTEYNISSSTRGCQISAFRFQDLGDPLTLNAVAQSKTQINVDWAPNSNSDPVLVAWSTTNSFGTPVNGHIYAPGEAIPGGGTVISYNSGTTYNHTGLTQATTYYYKAWSNKFGATQYSPGISTSATTYCCESFSMDFEACTDYSTEFLPWQSLDVDGLPGYQSSDCDFPGETSAFGWMAFNPVDAGFTGVGNTHGGVRCGMSICPGDASQSNDWLISEKLTMGTGSSITFWANSPKPGDWGNDAFKVLVSTTTNSPASFTSVSGTNPIEAPATWTEFTYSLSAYNNQQIYVAIQHISTDKFILFVDDIQVNTSLSAAPTANFTSSSTSVCQGNAVTFTDLSTNSPTSWSWTISGGNPSTSTLQNPSITFSTPGTYNVSLTATNSNGFDTKTVNSYITIKPNPTVSLGGNQSACQGASVTLNAGNAGSTYSWTGGTTQQTLSVNTGGTYSVTVTNANGCSASSSSIVSFTSPPTAGITPSLASVCIGETLTLNANPVAGGAPISSHLWTGNVSPLSSATVSNPSFLSSTPGSYSLYYTATDNNGCTGTASIAVTVNANPTVDLGSNPSICSGASVSINAGNQWSAVSWSTGASTSSINVTTTGTYTVTVTDGNGCSGIDAAIVNINPNPVINLGGNQSACTGNNITLDAGSNGATYVWSTGGSTQTLLVTSTGTYGVTVTDANGCFGSDVSTVNFGNGLIVDLGDPSGCTGNNIILDAGVSGATYLWSTGAASQTISVNSGGSYSVTVTNGSGCTGSDLSVVTFNGLPTVVAIASSPSVCAGSELTLTGFGASTYVWNNNVSNGVAFVPVISSIYTVTGTDANGCGASDNIYVEVINNPVAGVNIDTTICASESLIISAGAADSYLWSDGSSSQSVTIDSVGFGLSTVTYTVTVSNGDCSDVGQAIIAFTVCDNITSITENIKVGVFPNPNAGVFRLEISNAGTDKIGIELVDETGKIIESGKQERSGNLVKEYNVETLAKGVYYFRIKIGQITKVEKVIIQ